MEKDNQSTQEINSQAQNPLGIAPVGGLIAKFAIPAIISMLVSAMYNIVDQIFIANADYLGSFGNAANTVVFPLTVVALAIALFSSTIAYYAMWALAIVVFALAVYYTVKQL